MASSSHQQQQPAASANTLQLLAGEVVGCDEPLTPSHTMQPCGQHLVNAVYSGKLKGSAHRPAKVSFMEASVTSHTGQQQQHFSQQAGQVVAGEKLKAGDACGMPERPLELLASGADSLEGLSKYPAESERSRAREAPARVRRAALFES